MKREKCCQSVKYGPFYSKSMYALRNHQGHTRRLPLQLDAAQWQLRASASSLPLWSSEVPSLVLVTHTVLWPAPYACWCVCAPQARPSFSRTRSMHFGPASKSRTARAAAVSTVFSDVNSVFGHLFHTNALAFCVCILEQRFRGPALPSLFVVKGQHLLGDALTERRAVNLRCWWLASVEQCLVFV